MATARLSGTDQTSAGRATTLERGKLRVAPESAWVLACLVLDVLMLVGAALASGYGASRAGSGAMPLRWAVAFAIIAICLWAIRGLYRLRLKPRLVDDLGRVVTGTAVAGMTVLASRLLLGEEATVATEVVRMTVFAAVYVSAGRIAWTLGAAGWKRAGSLGRPTLIVGAGKVGRLVARRLLTEPESGLRPVAFLDPDPLPDTSGGPDLPVISTTEALDDVVDRFGVRQVVLTFSMASNDVFLSLVKRCNELGLGVSIVPRLFERLPDRLDVSRLGGLPLMTVRPSNPRGIQYAVKYVLDPLLAAMILLVISPILLAAAFAVWLDSGRPIFFRQVRLGRDGRRFEMLKFRTMAVSDLTSVPLDLIRSLRSGGVEGEDRRTRVGRYLRRFSIDELPQLLNVLKGEMSLVGPRPERPEWVSEFERLVHRYGERSRVKAGITGWAQVHGLRGQTSLTDRAEWDNYYIENFSLWLDLKIMLMTIAAVARFSRSVE
ncbi:MAG TPA: sugar transferase [Candidatus Limnocylindrales bacterium]|nr:sugar transferase [Candidatus Limnocylindrales bacterium]